MANRRFTQFFNTLHNKPVLLDCNFVVDSTSANGLTGLVGPGIQAVYMHSSSAGASNPNPAAGYILVQLQDCYNKVFGGSGAFRAPNSGSSIKIDNSAMTAHQPYVITTLGNATLAKWQAIGVPVGITPAVGVSFIAASNGGAGNTLTSRVQVPAVAVAGHIEMIGNPDLTIVSSAATVSGVSSGAYVMFQCVGATDAATTTPIALAPADGTIIQLSLYLSSSRIAVQGE